MITLDARGNMICECNEGYDGQDCKNCAPSFIKTSEGNCVLSSDTYAADPVKDSKNQFGNEHTNLIISEASIPDANDSRSYSNVLIFILVGLSGAGVIVIIRRYIKEAGVGRQSAAREM